MRPSWAQLAAIAGRAEAAGAPVLAADADDRFVRSAIAAADTEAADTAARAELAVGERAGDDTSRVRALVALIELVARRGDYKAATDDDDGLRAIVTRHALAPPDDVAVSSAEGAAFVTLGDRARGEAAWTHALAAAHVADDRDGVVRAEVALAVARYALHDDARGAIVAGLAAIRAAGGASSEARTAALTAAGNVALAVGDVDAAKAAFEGPAVGLARRIGAIRVRGLTGDVTRALAELDTVDASIAAGADADRIRIAVARAHILHAAGRDDDALRALGPAQWAMQAYQMAHRRPWPGLDFDEHVDAELLRCEVEIAARALMPCDEPRRLVSNVAPLALVRARAALGHARAVQTPRQVYLEQEDLEIALPSAIDAGLDPLAIAELHWRLARARIYPVAKSRIDARAARAHSQRRARALPRSTRGWPSTPSPDLAARRAAAPAPGAPPRLAVATDRPVDFVRRASPSSLQVTNQRKEEAR